MIDDSKTEKMGNSASIVFTKSPSAKKMPISFYDNNKENAHQTMPWTKPTSSIRSPASNPRTEETVANDHLQKMPERSSMPVSTRSVFRNLRKPVGKLEPPPLESGLLGSPGLDERTIQPMNSASSSEPEKASNEKLQANFDSASITEHHSSEKTPDKISSLLERTQIVGYLGNRIWKGYIFV